MGRTNRSDHPDQWLDYRNIRKLYIHRDVQISVIWEEAASLSLKNPSSSVSWILFRTNWIISETRTHSTHGLLLPLGLYLALFLLIMLLPLLLPLLLLLLLLLLSGQLLPPVQVQSCYWHKHLKPSSVTSSCGTEILKFRFIAVENVLERKSRIPELRQWLFQFLFGRQLAVLWVIKDSCEHKDNITPVLNISFLLLFYYCSHVSEDVVPKVRVRTLFSIWGEVGVDQQDVILLVDR